MSETHTISRTRLVCATELVIHKLGDRLTTTEAEKVRDVVATANKIAFGCGYERGVGCIAAQADLDGNAWSYFGAAFDREFPVTTWGLWGILEIAS